MVYYSLYRQSELKLTRYDLRYSIPDLAWQKCLDFPSKRRRLGVISQFVSGYFTSRIRHPQPGRLTIHNASIFNFFLKIPKEMFWLFSETTLNRPPLCFYLSNKLREVYFFYSKLIPMPINEHCSINNR